MVAMSGGIDSTITAYLLQNRGYEIEGVYMKLHNSPSYHEKNIQNIEKVTKFLNIKYHILDLSFEFDKEVYYPFIETYKKGLTPNPCVICNRKIKLGKLVEFAKEKQFDFLATGHYAKIKDGFIYEAKDKKKDQSYFISNIKKENIPNIIFPLGDMYKDEIKKIAENIDVLKEFATQKESTEICFVENSYIDILSEHFDVNKRGLVQNMSGDIIGEHRGYMHYTIGKRKGFTLKQAHTPHYVLQIDAKNNTIVVGSKDELKVKNFLIKDLNMFVKGKVFNTYVKIRYRSPKVKCILSIKEDDSAVVELNEPVEGLAPGQAAVFYDDDKVIGSGWIIGEIKNG